MNATLIAIPAKIPISIGSTRHATNALIPGIKSVFLLRHIGFTTRTSTMNITAAIMMDASAAFGM